MTRSTRELPSSMHESKAAPVSESAVVVTVHSTEPAVSATENSTADRRVSARNHGERHREETTDLGARIVSTLAGSNLHAASAADPKPSGDTQDKGCALQ